MFANNPICKLFGIQYPIVQAGMVWCSGWRLASAVSNAGGLGLIGSGSMYPDVLRAHIQKAKAATQKPFGVNVPLLYPAIKEHMDVIVAEGVRIVFTSAGNPKTWTPFLRDHGITVVHVVPGARFAQKAEAAGVHAIVAEGFEAGGHNGPAEITTMCLVPQVRAATSLPLLAAGGIATGGGMLAALCLGADGVQVGTRFAATAESSAHNNFKQAIVHTPEDGTMLAMKKLVPVRLIKNKFYEQVRTLEDRGARPEELGTLLGMGRAKRGMFEGDLDEGELEIGQISGLIHDVLPAAQVVEQLVAEYAVAKSQIGDINQRF
jgi:enoyl-[acyl-carrier protein] reductase II